MAAKSCRLVWRPLYMYAYTPHVGCYYEKGGIREQEDIDWSPQVNAGGTKELSVNLQRRTDREWMNGVESERVEYMVGKGRKVFEEKKKFFKKKGRKKTKRGN